MTGKLHDSRHHPYSSRSQSKKHDPEDAGSGLGGTKSNLDRETVMRALREKVGPRQSDEVKDDSSINKESDKKEAERKKSEGTRDVMALEQLVDSNGAGDKD